jgi:hypothetical protein
LARSIASSRPATARTSVRAMITKSDRATLRLPLGSSREIRCGQLQPPFEMGAALQRHLILDWIAATPALSNSRTARVMFRSLAPASNCRSLAADFMAASNPSARRPADSSKFFSNLTFIRSPTITAKHTLTRR